MSVTLLAVIDDLYPKQCFRLKAPARGYAYLCVLTLHRPWHPSGPQQGSSRRLSLPSAVRPCGLLVWSDSPQAAASASLASPPGHPVPALTDRHATASRAPRHDTPRSTLRPTLTSRASASGSSSCAAAAALGAAGAGRGKGVGARVRRRTLPPRPAPTLPPPPLPLRTVADCWPSPPAPSRPFSELSNEPRS